MFSSKSIISEIKILKRSNITKMLKSHNMSAIPHKPIGNKSKQRKQGLNIFRIYSKK